MWNRIKCALRILFSLLSDSKRWIARSMPVKLAQVEAVAVEVTATTPTLSCLRPAKLAERALGPEQTTATIGSIQSSSSSSSSSSDSGMWLATFALWLTRRAPSSKLQYSRLVKFTAALQQLLQRGSGWVSRKQVDFRRRPLAAQTLFTGVPQVRTAP